MGDMEGGGGGVGTLEGTGGGRGGRGGVRGSGWGCRRRRKRAQLMIVCHGRTRRTLEDDGMDVEREIRGCWTKIILL